MLSRQKMPSVASAPASESESAPDMVSESNQEAQAAIGDQGTAVASATPVMDALMAGQAAEEDAGGTPGWAVDEEESDAASEESETAEEAEAVDGAESDAASAEPPPAPAQEGADTEAAEEGEEGEVELVEREAAPLEVAEVEGEALALPMMTPVDMGAGERVAGEAVTDSSLVARLSADAVGPAPALDAAAPDTWMPDWSEEAVKDEPDLTDAKRVSLKPKGRGMPVSAGPEPLYELVDDFAPELLAEHGTEGISELDALHHEAWSTIALGPGAEELRGMDLDVELPFGDMMSERPIPMDAKQQWVAMVAQAQGRQAQIVGQARHELQATQLESLATLEAQSGDLREQTELRQTALLSELSSTADTARETMHADYAKGEEGARDEAKESEGKAMKLYRKAEKKADKLPKRLRKLAKKIMRRFFKRIAKAFDKAERRIKKRFKDLEKRARKLVSDLRQKVVDGWNTIKDELASTIETLRSETIPMLVEQVRSTTESLKERVQTGVQDVATDLKERGQSLANDIKDGITDAGNAAISGLETAGDWVGDRAQDGWEASEGARETMHKATDGIKETGEDFGEIARNPGPTVYEWATVLGETFAMDDVAHWMGLDANVLEFKCGDLQYKHDEVQDDWEGGTKDEKPELAVEWEGLQAALLEAQEAVSARDRGDFDDAYERGKEHYAYYMGGA